MRLDFLRNVHSKAKDFIHIQNKSAALACIGAELFDGRVTLTSKFCRLNARFRVVNVSRMDDDRKQISHHIYNDVPLSAFRFFPPSMPRSSLAATVLTLWASMIP